MLAIGSVGGYHRAIRDLFFVAQRDSVAESLDRAVADELPDSGWADPHVGFASFGTREV